METKRIPDRFKKANSRAFLPPTTADKLTRETENCANILASIILRNIERGRK